MQSTLSHLFSQVPQVEIPRSQFDRSHGLKTTFDAGYLVPIFVDEALPGDTFNLSLTAFARMATPIKPIMDNVFLDTFFFTVPLRLIWSNFRKFMGEQANPGDSTSYIVPTMTSPAGGYLNSTLQDYLGLPTQVAGITHSAFWTRAYNLIWNEWFRDQNLQPSVTVDTGDGPDTPSNYTLLKRGKRHDYFTSALPWPQKGSSVSIPLGTKAPIQGLFTKGTITTTDSSWYNIAGTSSPSRSIYNSDVTNGRYIGIAATGSTDNHNLDFYADLTNATAATINQLRQAFQIQRLYERDARGGTRYAEIVKSHFGVTFPDLSYRPEYLGGGTTMVNVNPIAKTSSTDATSPQGNLAAMATASIHGHGFVKSFTEHSVIIGLACVRADMTYQQGLNRMFSRSTRLDYYWPALAHIGEQSILNQEIYAQGTTADANVFGYQERYAEYRYKPSQITGRFRSNYATPLDSWHLAQYYTSLPTLSATFIQETPPISRVVAVTTEPQFLFDSYFTLRCARPMPVYSVPGLIDHF